MAISTTPTTLSGEGAVLGDANGTSSPGETRPWKQVDAFPAFREMSHFSACVMYIHIYIRACSASKDKRLGSFDSSQFSGGEKARQVEDTSYRHATFGDPLPWSPQMLVWEAPSSPQLTGASSHRGCIRIRPSNSVHVCVDSGVDGWHIYELYINSSRIVENCRVM